MLSFFFGNSHHSFKVININIINITGIDKLNASDNSKTNKIKKKLKTWTAESNIY